jgi:hypothetical protein
VVPWLHSSEQGVHVHDGTLASMVKRTDNNVGIRLGCCLVNGVVMVMTVDEESEKPRRSTEPCNAKGTVEKQVLGTRVQ